LNDFQDMITKSISHQSYNLLSFFHNEERQHFDFEETAHALPGSKPGARRELVSDMVRRGLLMRLKNGVYQIIPFEQNPDTFMPNWHIMAGQLVNGGKHYIGYYSALQIHGLITQPSLKEQIVVAKQIKPSELVIKNIPFQFIYHNPKHFFGNKKTWIDDHHKAECSDLEKTIIDCLYKPDYAGGISEIAKAIFAAKSKIRFDVLLNYVREFDAQSVIKRLGYLLELLEINTPIIESLQGMKSSSYILLDTELPKSGKYLSRWSIQLNMDVDTIRGGIDT
jgi:predicted transcriptional regulator of viral defense system